MKNWTFIFFLIPIIGWSQNESSYKDVSIAELQMKNYALDTTASALVLIDKGESALEPGSNLGTTFRQYVRIKIFKREAIDEWGSITIRTEKNHLSKLKGAIYTLENGSIKKTALSETSFYKTKADKRHDETNIIFPDVKVGAILEYSYVANYTGYFLPGWMFQTSVPTAHSEYSVLVPPMTPFTTDLRGPLKITSHESTNENRLQRWIMNDVPAFKPEPLMPHKDIYISSINFYNSKNTWSGLQNALVYDDNFGQVILEHNYLNKKVKELTAGLTDNKKKMIAILNYVKQTVSWDGTSDFYSVIPSEILQKQKGSSGDINLLLASMLKKAELHVNPVLLSTRDNGFVLKQYPSLYQFNYVICRVRIDDTYYLLDATEKYLPENVLPERCLNHTGFVVNVGKFEENIWIDIYPTQKVKTSANADLVLRSDGSLTGTVTFTKDGYAAFEARKEFQELGEEKYKTDAVPNKQWSVTSSSIQNMDNLEKPVKESYDVVVNDQVNVTDDLLYITPHFLLREELNPFTFDKREYPVDFGELTERVVVCNITIPDDYVVEELPQSKVFALPEDAAKCTFNISHTGNRILIMTRLQINKTIFLQDEYFNLKEFYNRVIAKKSEQIILKKKKS